MAVLSDIIEVMIRQMLDENGGLVEIARNDFASKMKCVPSQINYVIATRFSQDRGYYVESRRGGGGGIRIMKMPMASKKDFILHLMNSMDKFLSEVKSEMYLKELVGYRIIDEREERMLASIISDKALAGVPNNERQITRSRMMKNLLAYLMVQR